MLALFAHFKKKYYRQKIDEIIKAYENELYIHVESLSHDCAIIFSQQTCEIQININMKKEFRENPLYALLGLVHELGHYLDSKKVDYYFSEALDKDSEFMAYLGICPERRKKREIYAWKEAIEIILPKFNIPLNYGAKRHIIYCLGTYQVEPSLRKEILGF